MRGMELARRYGEERLQKAAHAMAHVTQGELSKLAPGAELRTLLSDVTISASAHSGFLTGLGARFGMTKS